jgi:hypothetical protein
MATRRKDPHTRRSASTHTLSSFFEEDGRALTDGAANGYGSAALSALHIAREPLKMQGDGSWLGLETGSKAADPAGGKVHTDEKAQFLRRVSIFQGVPFTCSRPPGARCVFEAIYTRSRNHLAG